MKKMPKIRIPVAPPGRVMKSVKDYSRKTQAVIVAREMTTSEE